MHTLNPIRYASFFTGIGGWELGAEQSGMEPALMCEIDKNCQRLLNDRWPDVPLTKDIRDVSASDLSGIRVGVAGFPCQGTSTGAPDRRGLFDPDNPSFPFWQLIRLLAEGWRPDWLVIENPDGLLSSPGRGRDGVDRRGWDFAAVLGALAGHGYVGTYRVLDALDHGSRQRRRRIFLVCTPGGDTGPSELVLGDTPAGGDVDASPGVRPQPRPTLAAVPAPGSGPTVWRKVARPRAALSKGGYETWREDGTGNTLTGFDGGLPTRQTHLIAQHDALRSLTLTEWERLQGFPDGWTEILGSPSARYKALGNAMHVGTTAWLARRLAPVYAATAA